MAKEGLGVDVVWNAPVFWPFWPLCVVAVLAEEVLAEVVALSEENTKVPEVKEDAAVRLGGSCNRDTARNAKAVICIDVVFISLSVEKVETLKLISIKVVSEVVDVGGVDVPICRPPDVLRGALLPFINLFATVKS